MYSMPARFVKGNPENLEGKVIAYVKPKNSEGNHSMIMAANSFHGFLEICMQHLEIDKSKPSQDFLAYLKSLTSIEQGVVAVKTSIEDIADIIYTYNCDIIEIDPKIPFYCPKRWRDGYYEKAMELALNDYFDHCQTPELMPVPNHFPAEEEIGKYPAYKDCSRETWRSNFSKLHKAMINFMSGHNQVKVGQEISRICRGIFPSSESIIDKMLATARQKHKYRTRKLNLFKDLIFRLEEEDYERAAKIRDEIDSYK